MLICSIIILHFSEHTKKNQARCQDHHWAL